MSLSNGLASLFQMTDYVWARHANPWSVWTRFVTLGAIAGVIWWRAVLSTYTIPLLIVLSVWIWVNPRAFPKPSTTNRWSSKAVLGERVWLNRKAIPIPEHFDAVIQLLNAISFTGLILFVYGLYEHHVWMTGSGLALVYVGKMWFLDRMVWLYDVMKDEDPAYASWLY